MKIITNQPPRPPEPPKTYDIVGIDRKTLFGMVMILDHATHGSLHNPGIRDFITKGKDALNGR